MYTINDIYKYLPIVYRPVNQNKVRRIDIFSKLRRFDRCICIEIEIKVKIT